LVAAISTFPVLATGIVAWQFQLEGQKLKGRFAAATWCLPASRAQRSGSFWWLPFPCAPEGRSIVRFTDWGIEIVGVCIISLHRIWAVS
jgi:hypothetical protein